MAANAKEVGKGAKPKKRPLVLDSSMILSGKTPPSDEVMYTCQAVLDEFRDGGKSRRNLEYLLEAGLRVTNPSRRAVAETEEVAGRTGDMGKLSPADLQVLALARELGGCVVTDDYSIQNVAATLKIPFQPVAQEGIKEVLRWEYRCRGCGKLYPDARAECDICGSEVRPVKAA